jgi:hypothetical protein
VRVEVIAVASILTLVGDFCGAEIYRRGDARVEKQRPVRVFLGSRCCELGDGR